MIVRVHCTEIKAKDEANSLITFKIKEQKKESENHFMENGSFLYISEFNLAIRNEDLQEYKLGNKYDIKIEKA